MRKKGQAAGRTKVDAFLAMVLGNSKKAPKGKSAIHKKSNEQPNFQVFLQLKMTNKEKNKTVFFKFCNFNDRRVQLPCATNLLISRSSSSPELASCSVLRRA